MATSPSNLPERPASAGSSPKSFSMTSIPLISTSITNGHVNSMANHDSIPASLEDQQNRLPNGNSSAKFTLVRPSEAYPRPLKMIGMIQQREGSSLSKDDTSIKNDESRAECEMEADVMFSGTSQLPFEEIPGEWTTRIAKTRDGRVLLSNYRFHVSIDHPSDVEQDKTGGGGGRNESWVNYGIGMNVPLGCIESVEQRDLFFLDVYCKDGRYYRIRFDDNSSCEDWQKYVNEAISPPNKIQDVFAFGHRAWAEEQG